MRVRRRREEFRRKNFGFRISDFELRGAEGEFRIADFELRICWMGKRFNHGEERRRRLKGVGNRLKPRFRVLGGLEPGFPRSLGRLEHPLRAADWA